MVTNAGTGAPLNVAAERGKQISNLKSISAETVNASFVDQGFKAPYLSAVRPREFTAATDLDFVRVHGPINQPGVWMVRAGEIEGMSATNIQSHLGLKYAPTRISPVRVSQGADMRVGRVGPQPQWGAPNPLGVQYELLDISKAKFWPSRSLP
jgi:filamentous hemagglutinin